MTPSRPGRRVDRTVGAIAFLLVAVVVPLAVRTSDLILLVALGMLALAGGALWRTRPLWHGLVRPPKVKLPPRYRWIPVAWVVFTLISNQKLKQRSVDAATQGQLSIEVVIELSFYAAVALVLVRMWLPKRSGSGGSRVPLLVAWPVWALATTSWSALPAYTLVRALELIVPLAFAIFTARVLDQMGDDGTAIAQPFFRYYVNVATALALLAFAFPYTYISAADQTTAAGRAAAEAAYGHRLAWYGVHPLEAAEVLGVAALILAVAGPALLRLTFPGWAVRLGILCVATGRTEGRTVIAGLVATVLIALWVGARDHPARRYLRASTYVGLLVVIGFVFHHELFDAALRGETQSSLWNLNGRIPLWQQTLHQVSTIKETFVGSGLGASRVVLQGLQSQFAFAAQSHNSAIEAVLGTGIIGLVFLVGWLVTVGSGLRRRHLARRLPPRPSAAVTAIFALILVLGLLSPELASPGFSYSLVCFVAVFVLRESSVATVPSAVPSASVTSPGVPTDSGRLDPPAAPRPAAALRFP